MSITWYTYQVDHLCSQMEAPSLRSRGDDFRWITQPTIRKGLLRVTIFESGSKSVKRICRLSPGSQEGRKLHDCCHDSARVRHVPKFRQVNT